MRSAMRAASQLPGKWPTDVDDALHLHVNQKSDYDDDENVLELVKTSPKIGQKVPMVKNVNQNVPKLFFNSISYELKG